MSLFTRTKDAFCGKAPAARDDTLDAIEEIGAEIERHTGEALGQVRRAYDDTYRQIRDVVEKNPVATIAIVAAATFLVGALIVGMQTRRR